MRQIVKDSTNQSVHLYIIDSGDGTPETGVVFNTSGIDLRFRREGAAVVAITEIDLTTPALTDAHEDGGFLEIGNGVYRFDVPDAAFATGAELVTIFGTVTGMIVIPIDIQLTGVDMQDATPEVDLTAQAKLDVNAEIDIALDTDIPELGVAIPTATPNIRTGLILLYMALRNKLVVQTSGTDALELHNDAGTLITKKLLTDDGSDYTEAEMS